MNPFLPDRLPEDIESERALLSTICAPGAERIASELASILDQEDFMDMKHRAILMALRDCLNSGTEIGPLSLKDALERRKSLGLVGGYPGLIEILSGEEVGRPGALVNRLKTKRKYRQLIALGARIAREASEELDPDALIEGACSALASMTYSRGESGPVAVGNVTDEVMARITEEASGKPKFGVRTGFYRFDGITRGFKPGELIILAARPGIGKTTLALNWALRSSRRWLVPVFSLEMSREEVAKKILTDLSGIDLRRLNPQDTNQMNQLARAKRELDELPIYIDDRAGINVRQIRAKVERLQARHEVGIVVVDYLQILSSVDPNKRQTETTRIGEISRELKILAKDCKVPVVVLSQLNREVEHRQGGKPQLSDLRDSGCIEQDADLVVFIHRVIKPWLPADQQEKTGELFIAKHRNGPCGSVPLLWNGELSRFEETQRETSGTQGSIEFQEAV